MGLVSRRLEECNTAMDELLARAEVPSAAVDYATGANGRGKHVAALLQAIAQFDLELAPLDPPRPSNSKAAIAKAEERKRLEMLKAKQEEDRLKAEEEEAERQQAALTALFGTGQLGDLVVAGAVTVPSGQVLQYRNVTVRLGGTLSVAGWDGSRGGELRLYVKGRLEVEAGGRIDLSGLGYREERRRKRQY